MATSLRGSKVPKLKILLSGEKGKFLDCVARSLQAGGRDVRVLPAGDATLFEAARQPSLQAIVFTVSTAEQIEPLRWIVQQTAVPPVLAVVPQGGAGLRKQLLRAGAADVAELESLDARSIRQCLEPHLHALGQPAAVSPELLADLHAAHSILTAIVGNAELALGGRGRSDPEHKQFLQIMRGTAELERILSRVERALQPGGARPRRTQ